MTYTWACAGGDCYPDVAAYNNGYRVQFFKETRPDTLSFAAGTTLGQTVYRLRSVVVSLSGTGFIRGYKVSYTPSAVTGRSLLQSVRVYGKDVVVDGSGLITGGTALPAQTFTYQDDSAAKTFAALPALAPTPSSATENVTRVLIKAGDGSGMLFLPPGVVVTYPKNAGLPTEGVLAIMRMVPGAADLMTLNEPNASFLQKTVAVASLTALALGAVFEKAGAAVAVEVGDYTLTDTVAAHIGETVGGVGDYSASLARPYLQSPLTIDEIIATGRGVPDPGGLPGGLRFDVAGTFRGSEGTYQLVVDPNTRTIYHFLFTSKP